MPSALVPCILSIIAIHFLVGAALSVCLPVEGGFTTRYRYLTRILCAISSCKVFDTLCALSYSYSSFGVRCRFKVTLKRRHLCSNTSDFGCIGLSPPSFAVDFLSLVVALDRTVFKVTPVVFQSLASVVKTQWLKSTGSPCCCSRQGSQRHGRRRLKIDDGASNLLLPGTAV